MTITTFEEHDETAQLQSEPSSPVLGLSSGGKQELTGPTDLFHEMKIEMRATKGAQPSSSVHDRLKSGLPTVSTTTSSSVSPLLLHTQPSHVDRSILSTSNISGTQANARQQQPSTVQSKSGKNLSEHLSKRPYDIDVSKLSRPLSLTTVCPASIDTVDAASARARLRKQRRMLSQNSTDQSEDPMERLNRLRARISGALSEVKGVLNKYSTEIEPNDEIAPKDPKVISETPQSEQSKQEDSGPIQFRFVKKVRRRSLFSDDETDDGNKNKKMDKEKANAVESEISLSKSVEERPEKSISEETIKEGVTPVIKISTVPEPVSIKIQEKSSNEKKDTKSSAENLKSTNKMTVQSKTGPTRRVSIGTIQDIDTKNALDIKTQRRPSDSVAILKNLQKNELKSEQKNEKVLGKVLKKVKNEKIEQQKDTAKVKKSEIQELAINKTKIAEKSKEPKEDWGFPKKSHDGKRQPVKKNDSLRRSSIAAVEISKIEPPVKDNILPLIKTQRRPSDSAAILKKSITKSTAIREPEGSLIAPKAQLKQISEAKYVEKNSKTLTTPTTNASLVDRNTTTETLQTTEIKNSCKDGAVDKQSELMPNHSINLIVNATSIPSSVPPSLTTVIGRATTETAITPQSAKKTEIPVKTKDLQLQLISNSQEKLNVVVPLSLSQKNNESNSQQFSSPQLNHMPVSVSQEKSIPFSTDITVNKNVDPKKGQQVVEPALKNDDIKKPINQQEIISLTNETPKTFSPTTPPQSSLSSVQQPSTEQVTGSAELVVIASDSGTGSGDDIYVPEILENTANISLSEVNVAASSQIVTIPKDSFTDDVATKANIAALGNITAKNITEEIMPELQMHTAPVKAVTIHSPYSETSKVLGESKEVHPKKKIFVKKIIRKNNQQPEKPTIDNDKSHIETTTEILGTIEPTTAIETTTIETSEIPDSPQHDENDDESSSNPVSPNRIRKIKKKVIIKRLQRRLSGSEQTFFIGTNDEKPTNDVETLEKAIAYVTDDEAEDEPIQQNTPLKSCMHLREYEVGDLVMYAERYKKTQVRWKKGRIIERITSISYKVDIGDKEVSAHIKDLKKYTGRKVRFGDKEYLEIDYEQIAEEEQKARTYSIWNLV